MSALSKRALCGTAIVAGTVLAARVPFALPWQLAEGLGCLLMVLVLSTGRSEMCSGRRAALHVVGGFCTWVAVMWAEGAWPSCVLFGLLALAILRQRERHIGIRALALAAVCVMLLRLAWSVPTLGRLLLELSELLGDGVGSIWGASAPRGGWSWVAADFAVAFGVALGWACWRTGRRSRLALVLPVVAATPVLVGGGIATAFAHYGAIDSSWVPTSAAVLISVVSAVAALTLEPTLTPDSEGTNRWRDLGYAVAAFGFVLVSTLQLHAQLLSTQQPSERATRWFVVEDGLQTWDVARDGVYGAYATGMFGELPDWLVAEGGECRRGALTEWRDDPQQADVLMFVNFNGDLSHEERDDIHQWIEAGGTLLVLADHTDVAGILEPTNSLIEPYGISLRFDSAKDLDGWRRTLAVPAARWCTQPERLGEFMYGIGGSFRLSAGARPMIVARYGFSDIGFETNYLGAYLGNYAVDGGERLGDICLVAQADAGRGSVIAFGDTTPFQNGAVRSTGPRLLRRLMREVESRRDSRGYAHWIVLFGAACGATGIAVLVRRDWGWPLIVVAMCGVAWPIGQPPLRPAGRFPDRCEQPTALQLDAGVTDVAPERPRWRSTWSGSRAATRGGFRVARAGRIEPCDLDGVAVLLSFVPLSDIEPAAAIVDWIADGGQLLFVGGYRHAVAARGVLDRVGIRVEPTALGRVPNGAEAVEEQVPRLRCAYPVHVAADRPSEELLKQGDVVVATVVGHGRGSVWIIADTAFLYGDNVESDSAWHIGNLSLLRRIFHRMRGDSE